jgi:hypothetical protein
MVVGQISMGFTGNSIGGLRERHGTRCSSLQATVIHARVTQGCILSQRGPWTVDSSGRRRFRYLEITSGVASLERRKGTALFVCLPLE